MRSLAFALLTLAFAAVATSAITAEDTTASRQHHFGSVAYPDAGLSYPEIGTPIQIGPVQFMSGISTQLRTAVNPYGQREEHILTTEVRGPPVGRSGLQFSLKLFVPVMKPTEVPGATGFFPSRISSSNPYSLNGRKTKAQASVGFTFPF